MSEHAAHFKPTLGLLDSTMIVAGSMIGSGIFIVSADIARNVGSSGWLIAVWVITGFMTLTAALSYGELSAMFPKAGGQYVYLKEAFNPLAGFLYGWSFFTVIQTATNRFYNNEVVKSIWLNSLWIYTCCEIRNMECKLD